MFGSHGHSHDGGSCNHGHSHSAKNIGFGDDDDDESQKSNMNMKPSMNPMMMAMMNTMKNNPNAGAMNPMMNPMMMMMSQAQSNPQMMEIMKKMAEKRQELMKEFMENGGQSNPDAVKELAMKGSEIQATFMEQIKNLSSNIQNSTNSEQSNVNSFLPQKPSMPATNMNGSDLLSANLNNSKLDDLINKRNMSKKEKEEQEARILDSIARKDYSQLNAVKATQYGVLERLKELVESGKTNPNLPDPENVYLLHWAAINNRLDIAEYLIKIGVEIDPVGGELETTPLNWAARSGHVQMCDLLIRHGASVTLFDVEGFSTIHLASMFGHSNVVGYLLVKGVDADFVDKNGLTPLMYAAQRVHSRDPAQLLLTFNARINTQDHKGNTALHYCVAFNNATVMEVLLNKGASLDIKNNKGQTSIELAIDRKKMNAANFLRSFSDNKDSLPTYFKHFSQNKELRKLATRIYPFFLLFYIAYVLNLPISWTHKIILYFLFYLITYLFNKLFFDRNTPKRIPMAIALSFITWLYVTWFIYFRQFVFDFSFYSLFFLLSTYFSWYNMYKSYKVDPGVLSSNRDSMEKTILQFVDKEFNLDQFCTACIIRRPLRSKHCSECDRCVAKFDHHCPWVDNCIGENNLKYFIGFLFWTPICLAYYMHGAVAFYQDTCYASDLALYPKMSSFKMLLQFMKCSTWVSFFTTIAAFNLFWISALFISHFYQSVFIGLTTNERLNFKRYKHFSDKNGNFVNPFNFGIFQNFIDLIDMKVFCYQPTIVNWKREYDIQDIRNLRIDKKKEIIDV